MDWTILASTIIGASIGIGSTMLADRRSWNRSRAAADREVRREAYAAFLLALNLTHEGLWSVMQGDHEDQPGAAARQAFRVHRMYPAREMLILSASEAVVVAGDVAFHRLRDIRDAAEQGLLLHSEQHARLLAPYGDSLRELRNEMRLDLGVLKLDATLSG